MATTLVVCEKQDRIVLDEQVQLVQFEDETASMQILEQLGWALGSAIKDAQLAHDAASRAR
jgi:hypothetical protein